MNKINAKRSLIGDMVFASKYEAKIYLIIQNWIIKRGKSRFILSNQQSIQISNNQYFPDSRWKADFFLVDCLNHKSLVIEAKGHIFKEFKYILIALSNHNPSLMDKLLIISDNQDFNHRSWQYLNIVQTLDAHQFLDQYFGVK